MASLARLILSSILFLVTCAQAGAQDYSYDPAHTVSVSFGLQGEVTQSETVTIGSSSESKIEQVDYVLKQQFIHDEMYVTGDTIQATRITENFGKRDTLSLLLIIDTVNQTISKLEYSEVSRASWGQGGSSNIIVLQMRDLKYDLKPWGEFRVSAPRHRVASFSHIYHYALDSTQRVIEYSNYDASFGLVAKGSFALDPTLLKTTCDINVKGHFNITNRRRQIPGDYGSDTVITWKEKREYHFTVGSPADSIRSAHMSVDSLVIKSTGYDYDWYTRTWYWMEPSRSLFALFDTSAKRVRELYFTEEDGFSVLNLRYRRLRLVNVPYTINSEGDVEMLLRSEQITPSLTELHFHDLDRSQWYPGSESASLIIDSTSEIRITLHNVKPTPQLDVQRDVFLGKVKPDSSLPRWLHVKNVGNALLNINNVHPATGHVDSLKLQKTELKPGQITALTYSYRSSVPGFDTAMIILESDAGIGTDTIFIFAEVLAPLGILSSDNRPVAIHPNPTNAQVTFSSIAGPFDVELFDVSGLSVLDRKRITGPLDIRSITPGKYFARIVDAKGVTHQISFVIMR